MVEYRGMKESTPKFEAASRENETEEKIINYRLAPEDFEIAKKIHAEEKEKFLNKLERKVIEPTPEQGRLLEYIKESILEVLDKYEIPDPDTLKQDTSVAFLRGPDFKSLVLKETDTKEGDELPVAEYIPEKNIILLWYKSVWQKNENQAEFVNTISHELLHAKAFRSLQAYKKRSSGIDVHRSGLTIFKLGRPHKVLFNQLDEGITDELAAEITEKLIKADSREKWTKDEESVAEALRPSEEQKLFQFIAEALSKHSAEYKDKPDEIKALFYNAYFSGSMQKVGRLIDDTFGRGTFRMIAEKPFDKSGEISEVLKIHLSIPRRGRRPGER